MQRRLQTLLADRFQVKVHRETREMTEYELVVAKSGSKLKELDPGVGNGISANCGELKETRTTISNLAVTLSRQLGRPVLDRTGLNRTIRFRTEIYAGRRLWVAPAGRRPPGRRLPR